MNAVVDTINSKNVGQMDGGDEPKSSKKSTSEWMLELTNALSDDDNVSMNRCLRGLGIAPWEINIVDGSVGGQPMHLGGLIAPEYAFIREAWKCLGEMARSAGSTHSSGMDDVLYKFMTLYEDAVGEEEVVIRTGLITISRGLSEGFKKLGDQLIPQFSFKAPKAARMMYADFAKAKTTKLSPFAAIDKRLALHRKAFGAIAANDAKGLGEVFTALFANAKAYPKSNPIFRVLLTPGGHFKFPHLWPVKFPQAGRLNYQLFGLLGFGFLSW